MRRLVPLSQLPYDEGDFQSGMQELIDKLLSVVGDSEFDEDGQLEDTDITALMEIIEDAHALFQHTGLFPRQPT